MPGEIEKRDISPVSFAQKCRQRPTKASPGQIGLKRDLEADLTSATRTDATALVCGRFWRMRTFGHIAAIDGSEPIPEVIGRGPSQVRKFQ
jgi:hypothetical protein